MAEGDPVIDLEIRPDGTVHFEVSGVPGAGCEELERLVLEALGGEVTERVHTPEYYQRVEASVAQRLTRWLRRK